MIIEIFGHACSGKSTLARGLAERLCGLGLDAVVVDARATVKRLTWPANRLLQAWGLLLDPGLARRGLALLGPDALRHPRLLGTLGGIACRARAISEYGADSRLVLVDEGVLHGAWSLTLSGRAPRLQALAPFLDGFPPVECAISVRPPRWRIQENLKRESDSRLAVLDGPTAARLLDKQEALLDWLEERVARSGRLHRVAEPSESALEDLATRLAERYRGGEPLRYSSRSV